MSRSRLLLPLLLLLSTLTYASSPTWVEVHSKNFNVLTDAGEKKGQEVAKRFEEVRSSFGAIFLKLSVNSPIPLQIIVFRNNKELKQYGPMWHGKPVEVDGFFQGSKDRNFVVLDASSEGGWHVVFHEYMHLLMNTNLPPTPPWFDEGFADYFSTLTVSGNKIEFGELPEGYPQLLSQMSWMKSAELFSIEHTSREYNEGNRRTLFYAQSWLTVHYLMSQKKLTQAVKFIDLMEKEKLPIDQAMQTAFGMTPQQFDRALNDYFRGRGSKFSLAAPPNMERGPFAAKAADEMTVQANLADLHCHELDHQAEGIAEFEKIVAKEPNNLIAQRGLGLWYLQRNDFEKASEHLERAAAGDSLDPQVHYFDAMVVSQRGGDRKKVREELLKAVRLDPSYAEAFAMLGVTEAQSGDKKEALTYAARAVALSPRNEYFLSNLVFAQLQNEQYDAAEEGLKVLVLSKEPGIAQNAQMNLMQVQQMKQRQQWVEQHRNQPVGAEGTVVVAEASEPSPSAQPEAPPKLARVHVKSVPDAANANSQTAVPLKYMKGTLTSVACDGKSATLMVVSAGKKMTFNVADTAKLIIINADEFSCDWKNKNVGINYAPNDDGGRVVSVEIR